MAKQVEVIASVERRRRWRAAEKERLVAASLQPGAVVSALAREAGIHPSQLYGWRRQLCAPAPAVDGVCAAASGGGGSGLVAGARPDRPSLFAAVRVTSQSDLAAGSIRAVPMAAAAVGAIEIEFSAGVRMRITGAVDAATLSATVAVLARRERRG
jgi:transposase